MGAQRLYAGDSGARRAPNRIGEVGFKPDGVTLTLDGLPANHLSGGGLLCHPGKPQNGCRAGGVGSERVPFAEFGSIDPP